jgi:hypothetical protein
MLTLQEVAQELSRRLSNIFLPDENGHRPCHGDDAKYSSDPHWRDLVLFHEYFHGETGRGLGASHQTGWTALAAKLLENAVENRDQIEPTFDLNVVSEVSRAANAKVGRAVDKQRFRFEVFQSSFTQHLHGIEKKLLLTNQQARLEKALR